ncbi:MAG: hypothetical protein M9920_04210 [Verrucomicrobiae bacterium]|nr:hypothetical protein [Verrucomicrobiae bacterium]
MNVEHQHLPERPTPPRRRLKLVGLALVLVVSGAVAYWKFLRPHVPRELMREIQAGVAARDLKDPDQRFAKYLEGRYGPMTDAENRERAFLDFFNPEHIRALQLLVAHSPVEQRADSIAATARWVAQYRENLTPEARRSLQAKLDTDAGEAMLRRATAQYNDQDVYYRGQTAPVISELLKTIHALRQP